MTANDIITYSLTYLTQANKTTLYLTLAILFLVVYFAMIWFIDINKSTAVGLAFIPILLIDLTISFGRYTFLFPLNYSYIVQNGVLTLNLIDWIFNFGIFKSYGVEVFNAVTGQYILSGFQLLLVYILTFGDSIIEFFILFYIFNSILGKWDYSLLIAFVPTFIYTIWANPLKELQTVSTQTSHLFYFFNNATQEQQLTVLFTLGVSFAIIVFLLSTLTNLLAGIGKSTVMPGLESKIWEVSFSGIAFGLALIYSVAQLLHPEYSWYVVLPVMVLYGIIRKSLKSHGDGVRERREQKQMIGEAISEYRER